MTNVDIVVPCYNEAEVLFSFFNETTDVLSSQKDFLFNFIFVDDGSKDDTAEIIHKLSNIYANVSYIILSRNFGKEAAMYAGLKYSISDYVIIIDADLQHPPSLIPEMLKEIKNGYECVAAKRSTQKGESFFRRFFSKIFFKLNNKITDTKLTEGAVDFRIMSRKMVDSLVELSEVQRFSKGLFAWVGFKTKWLSYENTIRENGKTKWSFNKLVKYALTGITSFSTTPLRIVSIMGFFISLIAFIYIIVTLIQTLIFGIDVPGYVTTLCAVLFMGGIIEISIGILGEYIGNIYLETKNRPIFIMSETNIDPSVIYKKEKGEEINEFN